MNIRSVSEGDLSIKENYFCAVLALVFAVFFAGCALYAIIV
jgi:hypothetical protein